ncbi:ATP-binding protein [bacterium]|nr:ATP-binding protein [bacterium]
MIRDWLANRECIVSINLLRAAEFRRYLRAPEQLALEVEHALREAGDRTVRVFIDEVQKLPELLDEVHDLMQNHQERTQFILTGSSARKLKRSGVNLLAGRAIVRHLHPFSFAEIPDFDLGRALNWGTLPKAYLGASSPVAFLEAYVGTYLKEEIQLESAVRRLDAFQRFLEVAAQMNGHLINYTKVGKDCHVSAKTVREYFGILEDTLLAFRLDPWARSVREQVRQQPKFYFFDNGVLNALRGELRIDLRPSSYRYGGLFETFVVQELHRQNDYLDRGRRFHHWRTDADDEVDVIVDRGWSQPPTAVEIKSANAPTVDDVDGLRVFGKLYPEARLLCLCQTPRPYRIGQRIEVLPWKDGVAEALA